MYYINRFQEPEPNIDEWTFGIWKIKKVKQRPGSRFTNYKWVKKIYDPGNIFKVGHVLELTSAVMTKNEYGVIKEIFKRT